jgi:hypothetical protein
VILGCPSKRFPNLIALILVAVITVKVMFPSDFQNDGHAAMYVYSFP